MHSYIYFNDKLAYTIELLPVHHNYKVKVTKPLYDSDPIKQFIMLWRKY